VDAHFPGSADTSRETRAVKVNTVSDNKRISNSHS
jgi:hypothetical protein